MKSILHFGINFSPAAYSGTLPGSPIILCAHEFLALPDGQLQHSMDGQVCATVPPAGFDDYLAAWPAAAPVIAELRAAEQGAAATAARPEADSLSGSDAPGS